MTDPGWWNRLDDVTREVRPSSAHRSIPSWMPETRTSVGTIQIAALLQGAWRRRYYSEAQAFAKSRVLAAVHVPELGLPGAKTLRSAVFRWARPLVALARRSKRSYGNQGMYLMHRFGAKRRGLWGGASSGELRTTSLTALLVANSDTSLYSYSL